MSYPFLLGRKPWSVPVLVFLLACRDNPALQARVDARARQIFGDWCEDAAASRPETGAAGIKIAGSPR